LPTIINRHTMLESRKNNWVEWSISTRNNKLFKRDCTHCTEERGGFEIETSNYSLWCNIQNMLVKRRNGTREREGTSKPDMRWTHFSKNDRDSWEYWEWNVDFLILGYINTA
jgi:hypothetical protein